MPVQWWLGRLSLAREIRPRIRLGQVLIFAKIGLGGKAEGGELW
jgi:hypothetical protein